MRRLLATFVALTFLLAPLALLTDSKTFHNSKFLNAGFWFFSASDSTPVLVWGGSALLDGTNDWFTATEQDNPVAGAQGFFNVSGWFKGPAAEDDILAGQWISGTSGSWILKKGRAAVNGTDKLTLWLVGTTSGSLYRAQGDIPVFDNTWHHFAATWSNGVDAKLYVDGVEDLNIAFLGTIPDTIKDSSGSFFIGKDDAATYNPYEGNVGMLNFWDSTLLTTADIVELFNSGDGLNPLASTSSSSVTHSYQPGVSAAITLDTNQYDLVDQSGNADTTQLGVSLGTADFDTGDFPYITLADNSVDFNGSDEKIEFGDTGLDITNNLSVAVWVNFTVSESNNVFTRRAASGADYQWVLQTASGKIRAKVATSSGANEKDFRTTTTFNDGAWHLVGFTFATNVLLIYVDGVLQSTEDGGGGDDTINALDSVADEPVRWGTWGGASFYYEGLSVGPMIFETAVLTAAEMVTLYNKGVYRDPNNVSYPSGAEVAFSSVGAQDTDDLEAASGVIDLTASNDGSGTGMTNAADKNASIPVYNQYSVIFNGTNEAISFGDILDKTNTDAWSVTIWAKPNNTSQSAARFVSKTDSTAQVRGWYIAQYTTQFRTFLLSDASDNNWIDQTWDSIFDADTWVHLAYTVSGSSTAAGVKLYKNGSLETVDATTKDSLTSTLANAVDLRIGANSSAANFWDGRLTDFTMYDKELSAGEVTELYNSGSVFDPISSTVVADVEMNALLGNPNDDLESGSGVEDTSINDNGGTAVNMTNADNKVVDLP